MIEDFIVTLSLDLQNQSPLLLSFYIFSVYLYPCFCQLFVPHCQCTLLLPPEGFVVFFHKYIKNSVSESV